MTPEQIVQATRLLQDLDTLEQAAARIAVAMETRPCITVLHARPSDPKCALDSVYIPSGVDVSIAIYGAVMAGTEKRIRVVRAELLAMGVEV